MFIVIGIMFCGILFGYLLRSRNLSAVRYLISAAIFLLLFLLGTEVGGNPQIMDNLSHIGLKALMIALAGISGSVLLAWAIYLKLFKPHEDSNNRPEE